MSVSALARNKKKSGKNFTSFKKKKKEMIILIWQRGESRLQLRGRPRQKRNPKKKKERAEGKKEGWNLTVTYQILFKKGFPGNGSKSIPQVRKGRERWCRNKAPGCCKGKRRGNFAENRVRDS